MVPQSQKQLSTLREGRGGSKGPLRSSDEGRMVEGKGAASNDQMSFREQKPTLLSKISFPCRNL